MKPVLLATGLLILGWAARAQVIPPPIDNPPNLPAGFAGTSYSQALTAEQYGPPFTWSLTGGTLPPGLALSSSGVISGLPVAAGTSMFSILVCYGGTPCVDGASGASRIFTLTILPGPPRLAVTPAALPSGRPSAPLNDSTYSQNLAAGGGVPPYTWSLTSGTLPGGLALVPV